MLTTLARVLSEDKASDSPPPAQPPTLAQQRAIMAAIAKVTARINNRLSWRFEPVWGTEYITAWGDNVNTAYSLLRLYNPKGQLLLLASASDLPTITNNGSTVSFGMDVTGSPTVIPWPQGATPIRTIRFNDGNGAICNNWWWPQVPPRLDSIVITGWWGYASDFANQWVTSNDTVQDVSGINASVQTVTVSSVDGFDARFNTPRFSPGNLIRIDGELLLVMTTDDVANTLSVLRGQNGTTATTHANGAAITIWYPQEDVMDVVSRQAAYFYARRGAYEETVVQNVATAVYPRDMVAELLATLQAYNNE